MITSIQNSKLSLVRGLLSSRKDREVNNLYIVEGVRLAEEAYNNGAQTEFVLFSSQISERGRGILQSLIAEKITVEEISPELMDRISETQTSQGILMVIRFSNSTPGNSLNLALVLDQVRDPGNMGTLLRSAAALGVEAVIFDPRKRRRLRSQSSSLGDGCTF